MEGDPRNPRVSLLKKYDVPVEHLSYEYVEKCSSRKELERIIRILRSGEEGFYPDLLKVAEEKLKVIAPDSRVLRIETPILTKESLTKEEWDAVENELFSWEKEMNIIDKSLDFEKGRIEVTGKKNMPEVRKLAQLQQKNTNKTQVSEGKSIKIIESNSNSKRIKSGDYAAWEKFDVDKELLRLDVQDEREQEQNEKMKREAKKLEKKSKIQLVDVDKENYSTMEQEVLANQARDRGNECYKSGDLESALKYYEISIKLFPSVHAYNNRALTYLKLKKNKNCIQDCQKVLDLEKNNVKALLRRATAYQNMPSDEKNNYNQLALQDLCEVIRLEPNNKVAQADLQKLKKKLNIEGLGKKFRMPISEDLNNKDITNETKGKNLNQNSRSNENLPLVYYGPSTSTFRCEPYSMMHRALSGSSIPGQVLCKCNSDRPRQNPLCHRCGEAMSTPKPINVSKKKDDENKTQDKDNIKLKSMESVNRGTENNINGSTNLGLNQVTVVEEKNSAVLEMNKDNEIKINEELVVNNVDIKNDSNKIAENSKPLKVEVSFDTSQNDVKSEMVKENQVEKSLTEQTESSRSKNVKRADSLDHTSNHTIIENSSGQHKAHQNIKKSKSKKNKAKDHEENKYLESYKMEPIKVTYADKYIHPTSVEPKVKKETHKDTQRECNVSNNIQYKAFVPNRSCRNTENKIPSLDYLKAPVEKDHVSRDFSFEGNKENIFENNSNDNVDKKLAVNESEEIKQDIVDSAYEFIKTWEELKKFDESYAKRAEILRKLRPSDLSKVIGIKLDSDMLSCLLECLLKHFAETEPKRVSELLKQLPQIPRFGLVTMFLGDGEKKKLNKLIEIIEAKGFALDESVKKSLAACS